jgi:hypothetical protein
MDPVILEEAYEKEDQLRNAIIFAREYLKTKSLTSDQVFMSPLMSLNDDMPFHFVDKVSV